VDKAVGDLAHAAERFRQIADQLALQMDPDQADALLSKVRALVGDVRTAAANVVAVSAHIRDETDPARDDSMLARVRDIAGNIRRETDTQQAGSLMAKVHGTVDNVREITADARPRVRQALADLTEITGSFRAYSQQEIKDILVKFRETSTEILRVSRDFSTVSGQAKEIVVLNRDNIDRVLDNFTLVSEDLKAASREVRRHPWKLLYRPDKKDLHAEGIAEAARAFASGAYQLDQTLARLDALAKVRPEGIPADDPQLEAIRGQLDEVFAKFNRVEQALWKQLGQ